MRVLFLVIAVAVAGCSGSPQVRAPHVMAARAATKVAKRLKGDQQAVPSAAQPSTVVTGDLAH